MEQLIKDEKAKYNPMGDDTKYSRAIRVPQYLPNNEKPALETVYNLEKYNKLVARIKKSNVSEEEKAFLQFAASRHIVFNYARIADYYAQAEKEMQELMEESALVILDMDDAIANGYVKLSEKMKQLVEEEKKRARQKDEPAEPVIHPDLVDEDEVESVAVDWKSLRPIKKEETKEEEKTKKKKETKSNEK